MTTQVDPIVVNPTPAPVPPPMAKAPPVTLRTVMIDPSLPAAKMVIDAAAVEATLKDKYPDVRINPFGDYPKTVAEVLDDNMKFSDATLAVMAKFKESKPYRGTLWEKRDKFLALIADLSKVYNIPTPQVLISPAKVDPRCFYMPMAHFIQLNDNFNIIVALHEFGHSIGKTEKQTVKWSINLFRKIFPEAYAKLTPGTAPGTGHMLYRKPKKATRNPADQIII